MNRLELPHGVVTLSPSGLGDVRQREGARRAKTACLPARGRVVFGGQEIGRISRKATAPLTNEF